MEQIEQDIPIYVFVCAFIFLIILSHFISNWFRKRHLIREGQLSLKGIQLPSIETRIKGNPAWAKGQIQAIGLTPVIILWVASIVWCLTFGVSFIKFLSNADATIGQKIILGIFSLGAIPFIYFAIRFTIRYFRYGKSWCVIDGKAGVIGKSISGKIRTTKEIKTSGDYKITLQCIDSYSTGTGKNSATHSRVEFQASQSICSAGKRSKTGIPFSLPLPTYPPETGCPLARGAINWQLKIEAPTTGVDYMAMFIVPVFKIE